LLTIIINNKARKFEFSLCSLHAHDQPKPKRHAFLQIVKFLENPVKGTIKNE